VTSNQITNQIFVAIPIRLWIILGYFQKFSLLSVYLIKVRADIDDY